MGKGEGGVFQSGPSTSIGISSIQRGVGWQLLLFPLLQTPPKA